MAKSITSSLDFILSYGVEHISDLIATVRARLLDKLGGSFEYLDYLHLIDVTRDILSEYEPLLAQVLSDAQIASWAAGADQVLKGLPSPPESVLEPSIASTVDALVSIPQLYKPDLAIYDLRTRKVVTRQRFDALSDAVKKESFTVAYQEKEDTIDKIREVLMTSIQQGHGLKDFRKSIGKAFDVSPMGKNHESTVFRTNILSAYASGRDTIGALPEIQDAFPFSEHIATHDDRVRPEHLALESLGLPREDGTLTGVYWNSDHEFWSIFASPIDYNCRCVRTYIGVEMAAEKGVAAAIEWLRTGVRPEMKSCLPNIPFRPTPGFVGGGRNLAI